MLHDTGVETGDLARHRFAVANPRRGKRMRGARGTAAHSPGIDEQPSQRNTRSSPSKVRSPRSLMITVLPTGKIVRILLPARVGYAEHEQAQRTHGLAARREAGARGIRHRLHHVGDKAWISPARRDSSQAHTFATTRGAPCALILRMRHQALRGLPSGLTRGLAKRRYHMIQGASPDRRGRLSAKKEQAAKCSHSSVTTMSTKR